MLAMRNGVRTSYTKIVSMFGDVKGYGGKLIRSRFAGDLCVLFTTHGTIVALDTIF